MLCPNCGYNQQEGNVCGECHTLLKSVSPPVSPGVEPGWKKPKPAREVSSKGSLEKTSLKAQFGKGSRTPDLEEIPKTQETQKNIELEKVVNVKVTQEEELTTPYTEKISVKPPQEKKEEPKKNLEVEEGKSVSLKVRRPKESGESPLSMTLQKLQQVLVTTTETLQGEKIGSYWGLVHAEAAIKLDALDSLLPSLKGVGGLRNTPFQDLINKAIAIATSDLKIEAVKLGANAIVGIRFQYEQLKKDLWVVHVMGTAVQMEVHQKETPEGEESG